MRVGILGGTFNPIHIGHLILAEEAVSKLNLDELVFVPTFIPPHKSVESDISPSERLKMVELAVKGNPVFRASTFEIDSRKKSYSIETLMEFRKTYGNSAQFFFITGSDLLKDLFSWKDVNELFKMSKFIVAPRPGYPVTDVPEGVETVVITPIEVSSEDIRRRVKDGRSIRYLVPDAVMAHILKRGLYK